MPRNHTVTLIPGDGTGPELVQAVKNVVAAIGIRINWEEVEAGEVAMAKFGTPLPSMVLDSIRKNRVALKGPITTPIGSGFRSVNVALRKELNLFACVRPCKIYKGIQTHHKNVDIVIIRENTEDLYAGIEFVNSSPEAQQIIKWAKGKIYPDANISIKPISRTATERIAKYAFEYAVRHQRPKVTSVTKANIMKTTDGLFFEVCREVAKKYPQIEYEERLIDNMCMQLVIKPELYHVILLPNLYGDILSDLAAGMIGGLGMAPGANFGEDAVLYEAVHGSAPRYKGLDKVNPTALLLSTSMMLEHLGEVEAAQKLEKAIGAVIQEGLHTTYDLGGTAGTREMSEEIIKKYKLLSK